MFRYKFMLSKQGNESIFERQSIVGFMFEPKFDAVRVFLYKDKDSLSIINEKGEDIMFKYPEFLDLEYNIKAENCVLDACIVVFDKDSKPDPLLLQQREQASDKNVINKRSHEFPASLVVFDILEKDGEHLVNKFLRDRKVELQRTVIKGPLISTIFWTANGKSLWKQVQEQELEGMMVKEMNSKYEQGLKSWFWLKVKKMNTLNTIVVGYTKNNNKKLKRLFDSLILAAYHPNKLEPVYVGAVRDGFDKETLKILSKGLKRLKLESSALQDFEQARIKEQNPSEIVWLKPEMIMKVKYKEMTPQLVMKDTSFARLRYEKRFQGCVIDNV